MKYKLFISDFDGTLVRADGTISDYTKQIVAQYSDMGGTFAVCSGRMLSSILPRAREIGLSGLVVACQGAVIADIKTGQLLKHEAFPHDAALKAVRLLEREGEHIHLYTAGEFFCNRDDELLKLYESICRVKAEVAAEPLSEKLVRERLSVVKMLAMVQPDRRMALKELLERELGENFYVTCSSDWLVEIMPKGVDKASAVRFLAGYYHVPLEEVAAIGDQLNDLPMVEAAGGRFAVANAVDELKRIATVAPSVEEDGVAWVLTKYAFGE